MTSQQLRNLADLIDQRTALDARIQDAISGNLPPAEANGIVPIRHKRRTMSPEARARIAMAARRRWKRAKAAGRNTL